MKNLDKVVKCRRYVSLGSYVPDEVLNKVSIGTNPKIIVVDGIGFQVKFSSLRLRCFKRSRVCVVCGRIGTIMSLDRRHRKSKEKNITAHFNLYTEEPNGEFVLMTQDHIIPKSRGGKNHLSNLQTMCATCNEIKGNKLEEMEI